MKDALAVIGSAGRQVDASKVSRHLYDLMYAETLSVISEWNIGHAVSGGAAFADHLAVRAFLDGHVANLTLFLPARFSGRSFHLNPRLRTDAGGVSNHLHAAFSTVCAIDSRAELAEAIRRGATVSVHEGFQTRNIEVANAVDHMLAFTFGSMTSRNLKPDEEGFQNASVAGLKITRGTAHCWGEAWKCRLKTHIDLNELMLAA
ncbi:hypothetical protein G6L37_02070 [Agrobacterium rubi]|nr:hypothetical protein [Agrobacterium rubi]NTF24180.1 hypothetical protein [Agrobacterium rubi]